MLELRHITAGYPNCAVLEDLTLTLHPGQVSILVGPNGCGKSTLLKTLAGILPLQEGNILLDGTDLSTLSGQQRAQQIAYLPQNRPVPDITVERMILHGRFPYLGYPRKYRAEDYAAAQAAMARMEISDLAKQPVASLSGGTRQKVYIAMALAQDTPVILMDEPTTFLDIGHQIQMMDTARTLAKQGKTVVLVLHDLPMAMEYADRLILMQSGKISAADAPEAVFNTGKLTEVFGVAMQRTMTQHGWKYYFA